MRNKYGARRTFSTLCNRTFASKAECIRGEELHLLELYGSITALNYQVKFVLSEGNPSVSITIDFTYLDDGEQIYEDTKGVLTRDFRTKMAWLKEKYGVEVKLIR